MRILLFLILFVGGCTFGGNILGSSHRATVEQITAMDKIDDGSPITVNGYYFPSYETPLLCQTKNAQARDFKNCLYVAMPEEIYQKYAGMFNKGDFVKIEGRFRWIDIEDEERAKKANLSSEVPVYRPYDAHHRIREVKSITLLK